MLLVKRMGEKRFNKIKTAFDRHEFLAIMLPSMLPPPTPFKLFVLSAGVAEMRFEPLPDRDFRRTVPGASCCFLFLRNSLWPANRGLHRRHGAQPLAIRHRRDCHGLPFGLVDLAHAKVEVAREGELATIGVIYP